MMILPTWYFSSFFYFLNWTWEMINKKPYVFGYWAVVFFFGLQIISTI